MRIFSYKLVRDFGFAPNPFGDYCTLATCKPQVRSAAKVGDIVVGCGSAALNLENRVIFAMRVDEKQTFQQYWSDPRFASRKPHFEASVRHAYGDNIYHKEAGQWVQENSHHSLDTGEPNVANLARDTNSDSVLISKNYVYWGGDAIPIPAHLMSGALGDSLYPSARAHRSIFSTEFVQEVEQWFSALPMRGLQGMPRSWA
ncbi:hypothetical protein SAMN05518854_103132 [Variovorax sp. YR266]|nr:hypothetical protein SAMN05518854_103132 [Variovorax sp. YR266]